MRWSPPERIGPYKIRVGDPSLDFSGVIISDPVPTGRQIIEAVGIRKPQDHLIFQILSNGEIEELRLKETTDLREAKAERFIV